MKNKKFISILLMIISSALILGSCGGGGGDGGNKEGGFAGSVDVTGKLLAPDGQTPIAGAVVYVPKDYSQQISISSFIQGQSSIQCETPPEQYIAVTCTAADGSFSLKVNVTGNKLTLKFKKGAFKKTISVDLTSSKLDLGNVNLPSDPNQGAPKMAVVTGYYDAIENVLAKLGFGSINSGRLEPGTEKFDLYDGDYSLDDTKYPNFDDLFVDKDMDGKPDIYKYDIVFINCGTGYENDILTDSSKISIIRDYVEQGGRLYVTDLSYDFVEQVFPEFIDFYGSDSTPEIDPENMDAAQVGNAGITTEADVLDNTLADWLATVTCVDSSNNPVDCINTSTNKVHIEGFLGGWAVINGPHPSHSSDVKIWVKGYVSWSSGSGEKPLTVSFPVGKGKILYTSYHTEPTYYINGLLPQERILQYLVFF
ncbi:MAG TPA: hypothetical protein ENK22_08030 [Persephonella sp.]|nr:hypothetical protein [Persephonella sp.]